MSTARQASSRHTEADALPTHAQRAVAAVGRESVFLPYQQRWAKLANSTALAVAEKSRRIGLTWGEAGTAVLQASLSRKAGGSNVYYMGYNLDMGRDFIDDCADWAKAFGIAASAVGEVVVDDGDKDVKTFRITFDSGFEIVVLPCTARSLRGKQGRVILDEAAFMDDLDAILKAALALIMWGGQVRVISTHLGEMNPFNQLIQKIRAGQQAGKVFRCTFEEALADGLYERIMLVTGKPANDNHKAEWAQGIRDFYGDAASEELDVIPSKSSGTYIPLVLLERQARDIPVVRWEEGASFTAASPTERELACELWIERNLVPLLDRLDASAEHVLGSDFARYGDISCIFPLAIGKDLTRTPPFVVEMRNIPYEQQRKVLFWVIRHLPRFRKGVLDATGNGEYMGEVAQDEFGTSVIEALKLTSGWYQENMPKMKAGLEDDRLVLPRDRETLGDFSTLKLVGGVPKVAGKPVKGRHGDAAVACALGYWASTLDATPIEFGAGAAAATNVGTVERVDVGFGAARRTNDLGGY